MQVSVQQKALAKAVSVVSRFVPVKNIIPVLSGLRLTAMENDMLVIGATDLESGVLVSIPATVQNVGEVVIPARVFNDFVKLVPDTDLILTTEDMNLQLKANGTKAEFNGFPVDEYPIFDVVDDDNYNITLPASVFHQILDQTLYSIGTEEHRMILTGQLWQFSQNELVLVATDVHRVTFRRLRELENLGNLSGVVPGDLLRNAFKSFDSGESVSIRLTETQAKFKSGNTTIFGRLINGEYPSWQRLVPDAEAEAVCKVIIDPAEMSAVLDRVLALGDKLPVVQLAVSSFGINFLAQSSAGTLNEHVRGRGNGDIEVNFNAEYFSDALKPFSGSIEMSFYSQSSPVVIKADSPDRDDYMALLLPVKLS